MDEDTEFCVDSIKQYGGTFNEIAATGVFYSLHYDIISSQGDHSTIGVYFNAKKQPLFITNQTKYCSNEQEVNLEWSKRDNWVPVRCR